jgi:hypothetical protein
MRHFVGLAAFLGAILFGVGLTRLVAPEPPLPVPAAPPAPPVARRLSVAVDQIVLDAATRSSVASLRVTAPSGPVPTRAWVLTRFTFPGSDVTLSAEPVEVAWPSPGSRTVRLEVETPVPWYDLPGVPAEVCFASVAVSTTSRDDVDDAVSASGAVPVLVAGSSRRAR